LETIQQEFALLPVRNLQIPLGFTILHQGVDYASKYVPIIIFHSQFIEPVIQAVLIFPQCITPTTEPNNASYLALTPSPTTTTTAASINVGVLYIQTPTTPQTNAYIHALPIPTTTLTITSVYFTAQQQVSLLTASIEHVYLVVKI